MTDPQNTTTPNRRALSVVGSGSNALGRQAEHEARAKYMAKAKAASTRRAYAHAWREFSAWCAERQAPAMPASPVTVAGYLTALAESGQRVATIDSKRAGVSFAHRAVRQVDPTKDEEVRLVMAGIRRELGRAPKKKAPVTLAELRAMVGAVRSDMAGRRDRALLLVGFAGAFRRSELVGLDVADLRFTADGVTVTVARSKTDQEGQGLVKVIPALADVALCPVRALQAWLDAAAIQSGPVFRAVDRWGNVRKERLGGQAVATVVKAAAARAGLDRRAFSGHSLRAGFVTAGILAGEDPVAIAEQTGHRSLQTLQGYVRSAGRLARRAALAAFGETR